MIDKLLDDVYETETEEFIGKLDEERRPRDIENRSINVSPQGASPTRYVGPGGTVGNSTQWAVGPDGSFIPCSETVSHLPSTVYRLNFDERGIPIFIKVNLVTDDLIHLPDSASERVLEGIQRFWESESKFRRFGQVFKRGVLLWGPPGSGKTCTLTLLIKDIIARGGTVLLTADPGLTAIALAQLRRVEPDRKLICVLEDIDELTRRYGEAELLALLDGESSIDNVVYVASTNYPEELDARLINRPSRFDEVIKIPMPSAAARMTYLRSRLTIDDLSDDELQMWVEDTEGLSIAHLREMVVAIFCLGREYDDTLTRLRAMQRSPKSTDDGRKISMAPGNGKSKGYMTQTIIPL